MENIFGLCLPSTLDYSRIYLTSESVLSCLTFFLFHNTVPWDLEKINHFFPEIKQQNQVKWLSLPKWFLAAKMQSYEEESHREIHSEVLEEKLSNEKIHIFFYA